jgi:hypothetical protein
MKLLFLFWLVALSGGVVFFGLLLPNAEWAWSGTPFVAFGVFGASCVVFGSELERDSSARSSTTQEPK